MINFLRYRYLCFAFSIALLVTGVVSYVVRGGFVYHIDFVGGTELTLSLDTPTDISSVRDAAEKAGWKEITIQSLGVAGEGKHTDFMVRLADTSDGVEKKFQNDVAGTLENTTVTVSGVSRVGAEVGKDIRWKSFLAVALSMLVILLYVSIRSRYRYAIGAVAALAHDLLVVLVVFLVLGEQISVNVLAAILAILGYSLNDTIVIFSRIRENMKKMHGATEEEIVNVSINQTLRRTLLTSLSTLLTVVSILILGGSALHGFALAMLLGVVFGTYSSIYIASPVMLALKGNTPQES